MPQAVQVETQSEQQGLAHLHAERVTGRASRELALHRREHRFDQGAAPVELSRKSPPHFGTHPAHPPSLLPTLGRDRALGPAPPADRRVIPLAVELGVGQHQPDASLLGSGLHDNWQTRAVVPRTASRALREENLLIQIRHDHALQPVPPGQGFLPVMMQALQKERADCSLRQAGRVDRPHELAGGHSVAKRASGAPSPRRPDRGSARRDAAENGPTS
jgi:hypothetical protein